MRPENRVRVVITGLGVIAPNGSGVAEFRDALRLGRSGIAFVERLKELNFRCQVAGVPERPDSLGPRVLAAVDLVGMNEAMILGAAAAREAWEDAGLRVPPAQSDLVDWDSGCILGSGLSGIDTIASTLVPLVDAGRVKRLGGTIVEQTMGSAISAKLSGILALGNQVTTNSSACNTGTEAIYEGLARIRSGAATRMLVGGAEAASPYIWGGFDSMRVLSSAFNEDPTRASRPLSASAGGFVPGAGAGVLVLETLEAAEARGARIYAELLGGAVNCGGHRLGGSMTAPNPVAVQRCIQLALHDAEVNADEIDLISGHLTATMADPLEVANWSHALRRGPAHFPLINATKSMVGHCLGAAGAIETVAAVLELCAGFVHPSINCEDVHPDVLPFEGSIPHEVRHISVRTVAKASFGFGDVNGCLILRRWEGNRR